MQRLLTALVFLLISILVLGCAPEIFKDNQVYVAQRDGENKISDFQGDINTEGRSPFSDYQLDFLDDEMLLDKFLVTVSPNGKRAYLFEPSDVKNTQIILGEYSTMGKLYEFNSENQNLRVIAQNIPFITSWGWNASGEILAFNGGNRLVIYDTRRGRLVLEDRLRNDQVSNFFWSPINANKIYCEHPNFVNGSIYYVNLQRKVEAYEIRRDLYFKGQLDGDHYYGTVWIGLNEQDKDQEISLDNIFTVITNSQGNIIKVIGQGVFRDAYHKSVVLVGSGGYGLFYIENIDDSETVVKLTDQYIYDVKFVHEGKIAYTTQGSDLSNNSFKLHLIDSNGKELKSFDISGSRLALSPDGRTGYLNGPRAEVIDFTDNILVSAGYLTHEYGNLYTTIRGAVDIIYRSQAFGYSDWHGAKKYFLDIKDTGQQGYSQITKDFAERPSIQRNQLPPYNLTIKSIKEHLEDDTATLKVELLGINSLGEKYLAQLDLELIKKDSSWYVAGFKIEAR